MWPLNLFFFVLIFAAIRTGDLWTMIPITLIFMLLHHWLAEQEHYGTDNTTERTSCNDSYSSAGPLYDTHSDRDNTKT